MEYLKENQIYASPESQVSATSNPSKERIDGGYNTYDNVLKLINIETVALDVPTLEWVEVPEVGWTVYYEAIGSLNIDIGQTPFIEAEWRDISQVGSGGAYLLKYNLSLDYNHRQIRYTFTIEGADTTGSGDPGSIPSSSFRVTLYIYLLNTKRRLDTYLK